MARGFLYLVAIMDDWAGPRALAWRTSNTLTADFCVEAWQEAITKYGAPEIFNADQDSPFTSMEFTQVLQSHGIRISMDGKGRCVDNQPKLQEDIRLLFAQRGAAHHTEISPPDHGRIETRRIWCSSRLNHYVAFPHAGQVFLIEREVIDKKSGQRSIEVALGLTSCTPEQANHRSMRPI